MNREFEFKQLLRAYRGGIIGEAAFEQEMARLETGGAAESNGANSAGFRAFGRTYKSERAAVVSFIDKVCAGEANGAEAFRRWAEVCKTECIRSGLRIVAEREAYHARVFEARMRECSRPGCAIWAPSYAPAPPKRGASSLRSSPIPNARTPRS